MYVSSIYNRIPARKRPCSLRHQFVTDQEGHAPRCFVGHAKFPLQLLRRDAAASARHQVHRIEPEVQRGRGLVEDRPRSGMEMMPTGGTGPRLPLLRRFIAFKDRLVIALRAMRMLPILGVPITPEPFQAGGVIRKLAHELHEGVLRIGRFGSLWVVSIDRWHRVSPC